MTAASPSAIGSLTKSFTALAVMQLVEKGKVDLDAPVTRYIPWFRTMDREASDRITVRMLLANSSGLASDSLTAWITEPGDDPAALERGVRALAATPLTRAGGSAFEYSNAGFNTAGVIVERVSGLHWAEYVQRNILDPLGMRLSTSLIDRFASIGALDGHTAGVEGALPAAAVHVPGSVAAGSELRSTAADLGRYLAALLGGGALDGRRVLSSGGVRLLWTPASSFTYASEGLAADERTWSYAMGWFVSRVDSRTLIHHGGNTQTMSSYTAIDPERGTAAAIFLNVGGIDADRYVQPSTVVNNLLHLLAGEQPTSWMSVRRPDRTASTYHLPEELESRYLGEYLSASGDSRLVVSRAAGRMEATLWRFGLPSVVAVDFVTPSTAWMRCIGGSFGGTFSLTPEGAVTGLDFGGFGTFLRVPVDRFTAFQRISIARSGRSWSVPVPKGWAVSRTAGGVVAASPDASVRLGVGLVPAAPPVDGDRWEMAGGRPWRERASPGAEAGAAGAGAAGMAGAFQSVVVAAPAGTLELKATLEAPPAAITAAVRDVLLALMNGTREE
jgi:CubicO group peptidase (beta-lactamase class C family)